MSGIEFNGEPPSKGVGRIAELRVALDARPGEWAQLSIRDPHARAYYLKSHGYEACVRGGTLFARKPA